MTYKRRIRLYANHLSFTVCRRGMRLELRERYDDVGQSKRLLGTFRSFRAIEQWLDDYMQRETVTTD